MTTPLYIEIVSHYCCSDAEFPRIDAPACQEAIENLVSDGLLELTGETPAYRATDGARMWLSALCDVPFPTRQWVTPKQQRGRAGGLARAEALSPERLTEIASNAAKARWRK